MNIKRPEKEPTRRERAREEDGGECRVRTIAIIIGAKNNEDVLKERYQSDGVEDQRQNSEDIVVVLNSTGEGAGVNIKGRSSDISIHHPDALEGQMQYRRPMSSILRSRHH